MFEMICFDVCALTILVVLLFAFSFRKMAKDDAGRKLVILIVFSIVASLFDIIANISNGISERAEINYICSGIYYVMRNAAYYMYVSYIISITGSWRISRSKLIKVIRFIPVIIVFLICIITPFTHDFYYYDSKDMYVRGPYFMTVYVCSAIYIIYAFYHTIKNVTIIGSRKAVALASCAILSLIEAIIQLTRPYLIVDILGFTLSILFIVLFIDNPGDKVDNVSLLLKAEVYRSELKTIFYTSRPVDVIHINVKNYNIIEQMLSYYNYNEFVKIVSDRLVGATSRNRINAKLYYIKNGSFRAIIEEASPEEIDEFAKILLDEFNKEVAINDMEFDVASSICISSIPKDFNILDDLLTFGTVAAKYEEAGKIIYTRDILGSDSYSINSNVDKLIENSILYSKFEVYYQPIYNVKTGKLSKVEALLRLRNDENDVILPEVFIKAAEENGTIFELGKTTMQEVCTFLSSDEIKKTDIECIDINLSVIQCLRKGLSHLIVSHLDRFNISPEKVCFEIRESLASDNQSVFEENVKVLADKGFELSLDEYGSGYSNITTLATMPISMVKLEKTFTNTDGNERHEEILRNSINMLKGLGKEIVAVGVETEEMAEKFKKLGCDYIQGFYYAKPMTRKKLIEFYEEINR